MRRCISKDERMIAGGDYHIGFRMHAGKRDCMPEHCHAGVHELVYCMDGEIQHRINGRHFIQRQGEIVFIREQDFHELTFESCKAVNMAFCTRIFSKILKAIDDGSLRRKLLETPSPRIVKLPLHINRNIDRAVLGMIRDHNNGIDLLAFKRFLIDILVDIYFQERNSVVAEMPDWLSDAIVHLQDVPGNDLSISRLVSMCYRSREHVSRSFRHYLNSSPSQWINKIRLERAVEQLTTTDLSVTEIAYDAGFESLNYFYQLFKRSYHVSPRQFRLQQRIEIVKRDNLG